MTMKRLFITQSYKEAQDFLILFKNKVCIVSNNRDPVFIITDEDMEPTIKDICNVTKVTEWGELDKLAMIMESNKISYEISGRSDFVNNVTL